jgi:parvulin-like peptidyl-prolyl isomerase
MPIVASRRRAIPAAAALAALAVLLPAAPIRAQAAQTDGSSPAVVVNGAEISRAELAAEIGRLQATANPETLPLSASRQAGLQQAAIDALVRQELLYQEAVRQGFAASAGEVNAQITYERQTRRSRGAAVGPAAGEVSLTDAETRRRTEREIVIRKFTEQVFLSQITETDIPDVELRAWYDAHPGPFRSPRKAHVREIFVAVDAARDGSRKAEARRRIEEARDQARKGADFAQLARRYSDGSSRTRGGDLGEIPEGVLTDPRNEAIFSTDVGQISAVVEDSSGYHLFQVVSVTPAYMRPYADVRDRIYDLLRQRKTQERIDRLVADLKENATIVIHPAMPPATSGK